MVSDTWVQPMALVRDFALLSLTIDADYTGLIFTAGILDVILHCPESILVTHTSVICNTVEHLLFLQDSSGNWPSSASTMPVIIPKSSDLVQ